MRKAIVGQAVVCDGYKGVVETLHANGQITVLLHGTDGWPFPTRRLVTLKDLSRKSKKGYEGGVYEEALF